MIDSDTINDKAIFIQSDANFVAYTFNFATVSSDGYLLKPIDSLGDYYIVVGPSYSYEQHLQFTVTAIENNTVVSITDNRGTNKVKALDQFQTWSIVRTTEENLSGYTINSTKPVAVFSGGYAGVPDTFNCCTDMVGEQLVPLVQWGQTYALMPLLGRSFTSGIPEFDSFFIIVAAFDDTNITFIGRKGIKTMHLNRNEHIWPFQSLDTGLLTADKPIMVAQLAATGALAIPNADGDPFFALLPSTNTVLPRINPGEAMFLLFCFHF